MFKTDRNGSNQHIWNSGEGAGSTDDNIYLRLDANGWVYFGWGRGSSNNECRFLGIPTLLQVDGGVFILLTKEVDLIVLMLLLLT